MSSFIRQALIFIGLVALALLLWRVAYALLLAFGGVLFAVFLRGLAGKLAQWTGLGMRVSLAVVGVVLLALVGTGVAFLGPSVAARFGELSQTLTQGAEQVRSYLEQTGWGQTLLETLSQGKQQSGQLVSAAGRMVVGAVDAVLAVVLVIAAGIYLAASPRLYAEGAVYLVPQRHHARARELLATTGNALWSWVLAQFVIMAVVGVLTAIGLLLVGVPLAVPLGLIAGLLEFIPFLGPFLAAVPIVLVALTAGPQTALYAVLVLFLIQQVESNLLAPLVERWAVSLPPVLILFGTIAFTLLFGVLGAVFAAPLLVVVMVWTKMLYMRDALGEEVEVPGSRG